MLQVNEMKPSQWIKKYSDSRLHKMLNTFIQEFSDDLPVSILRVPARINLKGVHIEHRGGYVNYMAINKEAWFICQKRQDDKVLLRNTNPLFESCTFTLSDELPEDQRGNWIQYIQSIELVRGHWSNYIKGGILKLQDHFAEAPLHGMNLLVDSEIPMGGGLSSSSSLVVGTVLCGLQVNGLSLDDNDLAELCGMGEWYVGTRGGAGDHAAMIFSKKDSVLHAQFFPFTYTRVPFPQGYKVVMCNSMVKAVKSKDARNTFNSKVATYQVALLLIKQKFPETARQVHHLRDLLLRDDVWLYRMLLELPHRITRQELIQILPQEKEDLESIYSSHDEPEGGYEVRKVCLFGLAECSRGEVCAEFLKSGEIDKFGRLMYLSHDGDRVTQHTPDGKILPWKYDLTDEQLVKLTSEVMRGEPDARLYLQPGGYGCSCEELDLIVDLAKTVPGVMGAGLTGAGLGGCVLVLVKEDSAENLIDVLNKNYYYKKDLPSGCEICTSVDGASFFTTNNPNQED